MEEQTDMMRQIFEEMGAEALKLNRKIGYDTGLNRLRMTERCHAGMEMLQRLLPFPGATMRDLLELSVKRFAELKKTVDAAAKEPPSIERFERVIRAMGAVILESAQTRDHLFELSGAFRRGFDILSERPKQPDVVSSVDDFLFTEQERTRIIKAILGFYEIIVSCGHDCYSMDSLLPEQELPKRVAQVVDRYRPDKSATVSPETRELIVGDLYFTFIKDGLWSYDGEFFRHLKRYFGAANLECIDPDDLLAQTPKEVLDFSLAELIASPEGQIAGLSVLAAMSTGDGTPEMAAARAHDIGEELVNAIARKDLLEGIEKTQMAREGLLKNLEEVEKIRQELTSEEEINLCRQSSDPEKAEARRRECLDRTEACIRQIHEALQVVDEEEARQRKISDELPPPRDLAEFKPVAAPPPVAAVAAATRPKGWSKYAGRTLKRTDGSWIQVEKDGATLTCPTQLGTEVKPRSYTFPNAAQIAFLEPLLDCFASGGWHKPDVNKSRWQGAYFKRGDAKHFHDDKHIALWQGEEGGSRGMIRLAVAQTSH